MKPVHPYHQKRTHCKRGHALDGDNIKYTKTGRQCRTCAAANDRARYLEQREAHIAKAAQWCRDNPDRRRETRKAWYLRNQEKIKEKSRKQRSAPGFKDINKAYQRRYAPKRKANFRKKYASDEEFRRKVLDRTLADSRKYRERISQYWKDRRMDPGDDYRQRSNARQRMETRSLSTSYIKRLLTMQGVPSEQHTADLMDLTRAKLLLERAARKEKTTTS